MPREIVPWMRQAQLQREGAATALPASTVHCGDHIVLTSGDVVPADKLPDPAGREGSSLPF